MTRKDTAPERGFLSGAVPVCRKSSPAAIFSARFAPAAYYVNGFAVDFAGRRPA